MIKTIKKIKKREKIFFLFKGEIFEQSINDRYYLGEFLYIETDQFNVKIDTKLINQSKVEFENVVICSNREELETMNVKAEMSVI